MSVAHLPDYTVLAGDVVRDRGAVLAIWRGNLGEPLRLSGKYDWFYLSCPAGAPLLQLLRHEATGSWVGACAAGRRRMLWQGHPIMAGVLVDLAVLPEHRSLGPALTLLHGLAASAAGQLPFLYGFPNPKAAPVFKRVGFVLLGHLVRHVRVLRAAGYLRRHVPPVLAAPLGLLADVVGGVLGRMRAWSAPGVVTEWCDEADARMDAIWAASRRDACVVGVRDSAQLRWRFDQAPVDKARYLLVSSASDGRPLAWFATLAAAGNLHVADCWSVDGTAGMHRHHVHALLRQGRVAGHASVSVELCAAPAAVDGWRRHGFVERGRRPVFGRWDAALPGVTTATPALYLTSADEDE